MEIKRVQPFRSETDRAFISCQANIELAPKYRTFSVPNQLVQRGKGLFDRGAGIGPVDLVQVDPLQAQAAQAGFARLHNVLAGEANAVGSVAHRQPDLGGHHSLVARRVLANRLSCDFFADTQRIHVRRVKEVDSELDGAAKEGHRLVFLQHPRPPVAAAEAHAPEGYLRDDKTAVTEAGVFQEGDSKAWTERCVESCETADETDQNSGVSRREKPRRAESPKRP